MANPMADKRKTNFIIACGYCLVASIILINYLTKVPKKDSYPEGTRQAIVNQVAMSAEIDLEKQLKEQKRMNQEMREMLLNIQNSNKSDTGRKAFPLNVKSNPLSESEVSEAKLHKNFDLSQTDIPELSPLIDSKFNMGVNCPFKMVRNPFALPVVFTDVGEEDSRIFPCHAVVCDPRLPYVFTGNSSHLRVISNY